MSKKSGWFGNETKRRCKRRRRKGRSSNNTWFGKSSRRGRGGAESVGAEAFSGKM